MVLKLLICDLYSHKKHKACYDYNLHSLPTRQKT